MSRMKKTSMVIPAARKRHAGMMSISESLDMGDGLTVAAFGIAIEETENLLGKYNEMLSVLDGLHAEFLKKEIWLNDFSSRMFNATAAKFGKDSIEYEKAGGVRTSARKHRTTKPKAV